MDSARYRSVDFEPLKEGHLPLLYSWLGMPHIREFYHKKRVPSWEEMRAQYLQRLHPDWPTRCFISTVGSAVGHIQAYRVADYPEYGAMIQEGGGISIDLFIGEVGYLGSGWGRLILLKFLNEVAFPLFPAEEACWIYHDRENLRALRASKAVGFRHVRDFTEDGDLKELMVLRRDEAAALAAGMNGE